MLGRFLIPILRDPEDRGNSSRETYKLVNFVEHHESTIGSDIEESASWDQTHDRVICVRAGA